MGGEINVQSSKFIDLRLLKALSKKIKVTINDIVNCALSVSLEKIFRENNDDSKSVKIVIPASIRFAFYPTKDDVKLENKFAAIPVTLPLVKDMESAVPQIKAATKHLKGGISYIYAIYAIQTLANIFLPRFIPKMQTEQISEKFTIAFSNTPGPIKHFLYTTPTGTGHTIKS